MAEEFDILKHSLVPKHIKLSEEEKKKFLEELNINLTQLPKIRKKDPAIKNLESKTGDVIKIIRNSPTNVESIFYRVVVHG